MKKRILALVCALTMVAGMSMSVCAASSTSAAVAAGTAVSAPVSNAGQVLDDTTVNEFATTTTVTTDVAGTTIGAVSSDVAKKMVAEANKVVGANAFVASIVDLKVPEGTGKATFTLGCPNVWAGQKVTILHMKKDGSIEAIKPDKVAKNSVTFTLTSYSPVAIVIDAAAPKTSDMSVLVILMGTIALAGAAVCAKKANA